MRLKARWILPIAARPIHNGVITIENGIIASLGASSGESSGDFEDLGDTILLPGFVNAHTHLELGYLKNQIEFTQDLPEWLLCVSRAQGSMDVADAEQCAADSATRGMLECLQAGVTTVGDISRLCHVTRPAIGRSLLRVISFGEVVGIGTSRHLVEKRLSIAADTVHNTDRLSAALSPHAPYSVDLPGAVLIADLARRKNMRICTHLAESPDEIQFLQTARGRFRELLEILGLWDDGICPTGLSPTCWAERAGILGPNALLAHGNYVEDHEIDLLCATGTSVAYCPRSHVYFRHPTYPLLKLMGGGVNVCVGTDSLASAPSLSVLDELKCVRSQYRELSSRRILSMGTINGARALGLAHQIGTLEPGKSADIAAFDCDSTSDECPEEFLLTNKLRLAKLFICGRSVGVLDD